jgi:2,4-dienoyl-CoA reductase-like NADH-dependent reductase (Old Yellow Enzyme family)
MKGRSTFKNLFTPGKIGNLELKNRIVKAPMWTGYSTRDGEVTDRLVNHYRENAKGGAGLIIVEYSYVDTIASRAGPGQLGNYDADCLPGLSTLADTIKNHGAKACLQLMHCGPTKYVPIPPIMAPSQITMNTWMGDITTKELTVEEINGIIGAFAYAAWRAQSTGFDMVEIE